MAVLCKFEGDGFTKEMYEELRKQIGFEHNHPKGEIFHAVGFDESEISCCRHLGFRRF
jgi:hypothetical protein